MLKIKNQRPESGKEKPTAFLSSTAPKEVKVRIEFLVTKKLNDANENYLKSFISIQLSREFLGIQRAVPDTSSEAWMNQPMPGDTPRQLNLTKNISQEDEITERRTRVSSIKSYKIVKQIFNKDDSGFLLNFKESLDREAFLFIMRKKKNEILVDMIKRKSKKFIGQQVVKNIFALDLTTDEVNYLWKDFCFTLLSTTGVSMQKRLTCLKYGFDVMNFKSLSSAQQNQNILSVKDPKARATMLDQERSSILMKNRASIISIRDLPSFEMPEEEQQVEESVQTSTKSKCMTGLI